MEKPENTNQETGEGKTIIDMIGLPAVLEQLAEESSELSKASLKLARKLRGENPTPKSLEACERELTEEIADVKCCLKQIEGLVDEEKIAEMEFKKEVRWNTRILEDRGRGGNEG